MPITDTHLALRPIRALTARSGRQGCRSGAVADKPVHSRAMAVPSRPDRERNAAGGCGVLRDGLLCKSIREPKCVT